MGGTCSVNLGPDGELIVPADLRARAGLTERLPLLIVEVPGGFVVMTQEQGRAIVHRQLAGSDVVAELLVDRRASAAQE